MPGRALRPELRVRTKDGGFEVRQPAPTEVAPEGLRPDEEPMPERRGRRSRRASVRIFPCYTPTIWARACNGSGHSGVNSPASRH